MTRVTFADAVHFKGHGHSTLCGFTDADLLGHPQPLAGTADPVTCPVCATLYCKIKNAPWNEVADGVLNRAVYAAVRIGDQDEDGAVHG